MEQLYKTRPISTAAMTFFMLFTLDAANPTGGLVIDVTAGAAQ